MESIIIIKLESFVLDSYFFFTPTTVITTESTLPIQTRVCTSASLIIMIMFLCAPNEIVLLVLSVLVA